MSAYVAQKEHEARNRKSEEPDLPNVALGKYAFASSEQRNDNKVHEPQAQQQIAHRKKISCALGGEARARARSETKTRQTPNDEQRTAPNREQETAPNREQGPMCAQMLGPDRDKKAALEAHQGVQLALPQSAETAAPNGCRFLLQCSPLLVCRSGFGPNG